MKSNNPALFAVPFLIAIAMIALAIALDAA
jgi:hypothetical protein